MRIEKIHYKGKWYTLAEHITDLQEEIARLNNIINELEKWIKENDLGQFRNENVVDTDELLYKLKELKENK